MKTSLKIEYIVLKQNKPMIPQKIRHFNIMKWLRKNNKNEEYADGYI